MADTRRDTATRGDSAAGDRPFGTVFRLSVGASLAFVLVGAFFTEPFSSALSTVVDGIIAGVGWLYLLLTAGFLVFVLFLASSRFGKIRIGGPDAKPEFRLFPWFAMLFQAGMGIGLLFWGVAEPVMHYRNPPPGLDTPASTPEAASVGMQYSFFHWTLHPWAIYAVVGLAIAYFSFNKGMPGLRVSSVLRPLLGSRVDGPIGKAVDILAVIATLFGVAVSLGLGTLQINAGLGEVFGVPTGVLMQLVIIAVTAAAYLLSASTPIEKGISYLSQLSMVLAVVLLLYVFVLGPTLLQLNFFTQETGGYFANLISMSLRTSPMESREWLGEWTIFFWATWIAWAPYVGAFIARISKGRTIREFVVGVLAAPSVFSMIWFAVLGASAIEADNRLGGQIGQAAQQDEALAMFRFLEEYPAFILIAILTLFLVWIFFVAGADAGTVVLGSMSGADLNPPRVSRLTWGLIMAALAAILLIAGGLDALQNGAILAATPFALIMVAICWALYRTLARDAAQQPRQPAGAGPG
ncbi:MAG: BCCT family transporter [Actinomycetota bacterium]|nr:BCCT family transporter [Actinomycetota bacterium]